MFSQDKAYRLRLTSPLRFPRAVARLRLLPHRWHGVDGIEELVLFHRILWLPLDYNPSNKQWSFAVGKDKQLTKEDGTSHEVMRLIMLWGIPRLSR